MVLEIDGQIHICRMKSNQTSLSAAFLEKEGDLV